MSARGFALPLVLAVLVLGGILVTTTFLLSRLESESGRNHLEAAAAFDLAETGLARVRSAWLADWDTLAPGTTLQLAPGVEPSGTWEAWLERLDEGLFRVQATGTVQRPGMRWPASRTLSRLLRWEPGLPSPAALTALDSVVLSAGSVVTSTLPSPPGWGSWCPTDSAPALRRAPFTSLDTSACPGCLSGLPPVSTDPTLTGVLPALLPQSHARLSGAAHHLVLGALAPLQPSQAPGGGCDRADPVNWGEPDHTTASPCAGWYPVVHAPGDLQLSGGRGQGVLLVDGDLMVDGDLEFAGLLVVQGSITIATASVHLTGSVLAGSLVVTGGGSVQIAYSACVLRKALRGSSPALPLRFRSWAQHY